MAKQAAIQSVNQQQAARLLGLKTQWMRDHAGEIPRNNDNTYSIEKLFAWQRERSVEVNLTDEEMEKVLQAASHFSGGESCRLLLVSLRDEHGGAGLAMFSEAILTLLSGEMGSLPTESQMEKELDVERRIKRSAFFWNRLESVHQCQVCKRVRCGTKWSKPTTHILPQQAVSTECPRCEHG